MSRNLEDFNQKDIALLRLIYLVPNLDQRAYGTIAYLAPLAKAKFIVYTNPKSSQGQVTITKEGLKFLSEHKLDHFGFEPRHREQYPAQCANNAALMKAMTKFTGHYKKS